MPTMAARASSGSTPATRAAATAMAALAALHRPGSWSWTGNDRPPNSTSSPPPWISGSGRARPQEQLHTSPTQVTRPPQLGQLVAASSAVVVVLPLVPDTRNSERPAASLPRAPLSRARATRPPITAPPPRPVRRDTVAIPVTTPLRALTEAVRSIAVIVEPLCRKEGDGPKPSGGGRGGRRLRREPGRLPGVVAAEDVGHEREAVRRERRGGDGAAIPAGAVDDRGHRRVELLDPAEQRRQRDEPGAGDHAALLLARVADVDELHRAVAGVPAGEVPRRDPQGGHGHLGMLGQHPLHVADGAHDPVEADSGQAHLGLPLPARVGDQHDRLVGAGDVAGVLGEAALEPDVDGPPQV